MRAQRPEASQASDTKAPAFDVTSVKPNTSNNSGIGGAGDRRGGGEFRATNIPLRALIREAFGRWQDDQIIGGPSWLDTDRWDIAAKTAATTPIFPMVRTLLADRFALVTHHETREMPTYALLVAKPGVLGRSFRLSTERTTFRQGNGILTGRAVPLGLLIDILAFVTAMPGLLLNWIPCRRRSAAKSLLRRLEATGSYPSGGGDA